MMPRRKEGRGDFFERADEGARPEPEAKEDDDKRGEGHAFPRQDRVPWGVDGDLPTKHVKPPTHHRDACEHRRGDDEQPGMQVIVEAAGDDQVVGDERQRAGEAERGQAK